VLVESFFSRQNFPAVRQTFFSFPLRPSLNLFSADSFLSEGLSLPRFGIFHVVILVFFLMLVSENAEEAFFSPCLLVFSPMSPRFFSSRGDRVFFSHDVDFFFQRLVFSQHGCADLFHLFPPSRSFFLMNTEELSTG